MSGEYYHKKWQNLLTKLEDTVSLDLEYQTTRCHDKELCEAVCRLGGIFAVYCSIYNSLIECCDQILQVQKTSYMAAILDAVIWRILELKHQLKELVSSECIFFGSGLVDHKLTPYESEMTDLTHHFERPREMQSLVDDIMARAKQKIEELANILAAEQREEIEVIIKPVQYWWDLDVDYDKEEQLSKDTDSKQHVFTTPLDEDRMQEQKLIKLIQSQERTRQIHTANLKRIQRREKFIKELKGILRPQAPSEMREKSAKLIQMVYRVLMESKRKRIADCLRDEKLGITTCSKNKLENIENSVTLIRARSNLRHVYHLQWQKYCREIKESFIGKKGADIKEDISDEIRFWFRKWYDSVKFFHDIPRASIGGTQIVVTEEIATPEEWHEEYTRYMSEKESIRMKSTGEMKRAKMEAKLEILRKKKAELLKKRLQAKLLKKKMQNPALHPGYHYPPSEHMEPILKGIEDYLMKWHELDLTDQINAKQKFLTSLETEEMYKNVHIELRQQVDEDMKLELKNLKRALKKEYKMSNEKMPVPMKPRRNVSLKQRLETTFSSNLAENFEHLALLKIIKEYPKTDLKDFHGEFNFSGDNARCNLKSAEMFAGEARNMWWEIYERADLSGYTKGVLLIGPHGSGKSILVHMIANNMNAVLFDLSPYNTASDMTTGPWLTQTFSDVLSVARAVQPSVIYIKDVHKLFYKKVPKEERTHNLHLTRRYLVQKLIKKIARTDKIVLIGATTEPWLAKSKGLLRIFPRVFLVPDTNYTTVIQLLNTWTERFNNIPKNFNVQCLATMLAGYSYAFIKLKLEEFITPERIVSLAIRPLEPQEVYDFIFKDTLNNSKDYKKHKEWYNKHTQWGKKEIKHMKNQQEFHEKAEKIKNAKMKKTRVERKLTDAVTSKSEILTTDDDFSE